jgi:hypothetical protein
MPTALANSTVSFCSESAPTHADPKTRTDQSWAADFTLLPLSSFQRTDDTSWLPRPYRGRHRVPPSIQGRRIIRQVESGVNPLGRSGLVHRTPKEGNHESGASTAARGSVGPAVLSCCQELPPNRPTSPTGGSLQQVQPGVQPQRENRPSRLPRKGLPGAQKN